MKFLKLHWPMLFFCALLAGLYFLLTGFTYLGTAIEAGILFAGAWGEIRNKVGNIVASSWKGINTARVYKIPNNPNTTSQVVQRARMARSVFIARQLMGELIQPYWDPFYDKMSGFNAWVKENIMLLAPTTYNLTANAIMSKGNLLGVASLTSTYNTATGVVEVTWVDNSNGTTGLSTDRAFIVVASLDGNVYADELKIDTRLDELTSVTIDTGLTATNLITWIFFTRGSGATLAVSDSSGDVNAAP